MIEELPNTNVSAVARRLVSMRLEGGVAALGRVLTLIIAAPRPIDEAAVEAANQASSEHPMRVIVLVTDPEADTRLDAEIRVGADAGASEVVVLHAGGETCSGVESLVTGLLLPDTPVVVWWPGIAPEDPGRDPLGRIAQRRITDSTASHRGIAFDACVTGYAPGDTDLAWTRITRWREYLASILDAPPFDPVVSATVTGELGSPSTQLLAAWLELALAVPTERVAFDGDCSADGLHSVTLSRKSGDAVLARLSDTRAALRQPGQPEHELFLPHRSLSDCLAEELRGLDEDVMYGRVLDRLRHRSGDPEPANDGNEDD